MFSRPLPPLEQWKRLILYPAVRAACAAGAPGLESSARCVLDKGLKPPAPSHAVTRLLLAWGGGDAGALDELMPLVHAELRRLARQIGRASCRGRGEVAGGGGD